MNKKLQKDILSKILIFSFSSIGVVALILMFSSIVLEAIPAYKEYGFFHMYFTSNFTKDGGFGIWGGLSLTLITSITSVLISLPISLRFAIFMKYRMKSRERLLKTFVNISSGIPSVVFGLFAIDSLTKITSIFNYNSPNTLFVSILMLSIMIFPTIVSLLYNQLNLVDNDLINSSMALGQTKTYSIYKIIKKEIRPQIYVTAIIALGRAIGETMALSMILTAPSSTQYLTGSFKSFLNSPFATLGVEISRQMFIDGATPETRSALFASGVAIFLIIMILIGIVTKVSNQKKINVQNPFNYKKILSKNYSFDFFKYFSIFIHFFLLPFKILLYFIYIFSLNLKKFWNTFGWMISLPISFIIFKKRWKNEKNSDYFLRYKSSFQSRITDILRIILEVICSIILSSFIFWIIFSILVNGVPNWTINDWKFQHFNSSNKVIGGQIMNPLVWTILLIMISIIISMPFSIATAIFLSEYSGNKRSGKTIRFFLDSLGGTPSILFGIFGYTFFLRTLNLSSLKGGTSLIAGALTITLVIIPTFTRSIEQVLIKIPVAVKEASYALGASKYQTIKKIIIPNSIQGISTGIILSSGRILAETAPIYLTLGMLSGVDLGLLEPGQTLTTSILYNQIFAFGNAQDLMKSSYKLASVAIILIASIVLLLELINSKLSVTRKRKKWKK